MKLIVQLRKNAYAIELALARVRIRDMREGEEAEDGEEEEEDFTEELGHGSDPRGTVYCQSERAHPDTDMSRTYHCDEIRAYKGFGFGRPDPEESSSANPAVDT